MDFQLSPKAKELQQRLLAFFDEHIYPNEETYDAQMAAFGSNRWQIPQIIEDLKKQAKEAGLWNLFLPHSDTVEGLSNLDYAPLCEIMGRVSWSSEVFNSLAPDTGNMEVLERYGNAEHKEKYLK